MVTTVCELHVGNHLLCTAPLDYQRLTSLFSFGSTLPKVTPPSCVHCSSGYIDSYRQDTRRTTDVSSLTTSLVRSAYSYEKRSLGILRFYTQGLTHDPTSASRGWPGESPLLQLSSFRPLQVETDNDFLSIYNFPVLVADPPPFRFDFSSAVPRPTQLHDFPDSSATHSTN